MTDDKIEVIYIVGPTASGKTKLAVEIAKKIGAEIVSADSMQIYKRMDIATAKPTKDEMQGIPHHLIDFIDPSCKYSVADYVYEARKVIADIHKRGKKIIVCGGTGLYIDSLINNIQFSKENVDITLRKKLNDEAKNRGSEYLLEKLAEFDEEMAKKLHPNNIKRIIRAIEIYYTTGVTMTEHILNSQKSLSIYKNCIIGLNFRDRKLLYDRINRRVDTMIEKGLIDEAKNVFKSNCDTTSMAAIGYKELEQYLRGKQSMEMAVNNIKIQSRRYAKRQITWFKKNERIHWIYNDDYKTFDDILLLSLNLIKESFEL